MENLENNKIIASFIDLLEKSISEKNFKKLTFSKVVVAAAPNNIYAKLIETKKGNVVSCTLRYKDKDIVQNFSPGKSLSNQVTDWLGNTFKIATLFTEIEEITILFNNKNEAQLRVNRNLSSVKQSESHNKEKNYLIEQNCDFLKLLSLSSFEGKVYSQQQDKYRQINKYCEIMLSQFEHSQLNKNPEKVIRIVDMGSGKGYLTFALYYLLKEKMNLNVQILGIERREELCNFCNEQSQKLGWSTNLRFEAIDILNYKEGNIDVLIALHACDTATDIAIAQGISNNASLIVVAPCCHKQIRKEMKPTAPWNNILKNGILLEREAELLTDAIRALLLETYDYKSKVFEFISGDHTPKNLMITASLQQKKLRIDQIEGILNEISALKQQFGIEQHYLEKLLKR